MKYLRPSLVVLCATFLFTRYALAGPGHDHGDAAPTASGPSQPRFSAQSDLFEAVGILGKDELVIFIDRTATNDPVVNASVELESGSIKAIGKFEAALGEYHFDGKPFQQPSEYPITLTIKAGPDSDLLTAELDVHGDQSLAKSDTAHAHVHGWREYVPWAGAALIAVVLATVFAIRRKRTSVELRNRSAA